MAKPPEEGAGSRRAQDFLELIERGRRGKLKVYIGSAAGVGKTYRMLQEAHALKARGVDVVLGYVETHGRAETEALVAGLEVVARKRIQYRTVELSELDLDAVLARRPQVVVVDELAHTNAPGERHEKRYEDVLAIVRAGINVLTAVNIQHLESLNDLVTRMTGTSVRETIPDSVLREADQVVNLDLSVEDLRERLAAGKIYPADKIPKALSHFFTEENLAALRELALREVAETAEREARRGERAPNGAAEAKRSAAVARPQSGRVLLALSAVSPNGQELVRKASRIAGRLNTHWYVVHVERPGAGPAGLPTAELRTLADAFELAQRLGAEVVRLQGANAADALVRFARENRVERVILGRGRPRAFGWQRGRSLWAQIIAKAEGFDVHVVTVATPGAEAP